MVHGAGFGSEGRISGSWPSAPQNWPRPSPSRMVTLREGATRRRNCRFPGPRFDRRSPVIPAHRRSLNPGQRSSCGDVPVTAFRLIRHLRSHPFLGRLAVVIGGTAAAQAITVAFSPLITRFYGPETFGAFGVFTAALGLVTPIATL